MSEPFQPPKEDLPPVADLMAIADVTEEDIQAAASLWARNPPDENFKLILEADNAEPLS